MPRLIFGTSCLGNLYEALPWPTKLGILREIAASMPAPFVLDTAGKYGAGLALESIGRGLRELGVPARDVMVSNKLGWMRTPLKGTEPTFEPGVWAGLENDAEQRICADGIRACWRQGRELLGSPYGVALASVHDPDEYLAAAKGPAERSARWADIVEAYAALHELKRAGEVTAIGVGSKDWRVIRELANCVELDWVMLACSLTVYRHEPELIAFAADLHRRGVGIVNSAVFHAGFLTGGRFFDYRIPDASAEPELFVWRDRFVALCRRHDVRPAAACVQFGFSVPGVAAVSLNTSRPDRVRDNVELVQAAVPAAFWTDMKREGLLNRAFPYLG